MTAEPTQNLLPPTNRAVLVFGATGYTGRLTVAELRRRGLPFVLGGRNRASLEKLQREAGPQAAAPVRVADPAQPDSLPALFDPPVGVIINCVGPFTGLGEPVVRAAVEAGVHYLDISGEQAYLHRILTSYDSLARQRGRAVVPACGVEYALTNWAGALAGAGLEPLNDLWTATATQGVKTSRGTQLSLFEALAKPGLGWHDGRPRTRTVGSSARQVNFPPPFGPQRAVWAPLGELVTLPRHLQIKTMNAYFALPSSLALGVEMLGPLVSPFSGVLGKLAGGLARGPKAGEVENSRWAVVAEARSEAGRRRVTLTGPNVYALTATITAWCASQMLGPDYTAAGALGPAQAFDPRQAVAFLQSQGVQFTEESF